MGQSEKRSKEAASSSSSFGWNPAEMGLAEAELLNFQFKEPSEQELLQELAEMDLGGQTMETMAKASLSLSTCSADFGMIRAGSLEMADYNVENVELTPEDEKDPELLTQLLLLQGETATPSSTQDACDGERLPTAEDPPDLETPISASEEFAQIDQPIVHLSPIQPPPSTDQVIQLKRLALEAKRSGNLDLARNYMAQIIALERGENTGLEAAKEKGLSRGVSTLKNSPNEREKIRMLIETFQKQIQDCSETAKTYLRCGERNLAAESLRRERAFSADLVQLRSINLGNAPTMPTTHSIKVSLPIDSTNRDIAEGELHLVFSQLSITPQAKNFTNDSMHFLQASLEWPSDADPNTRTKSTVLFKLNSACTDPSFNQRLLWTGIRRDIRTQKYFEYHKLRIELLRQESGFFRKKNISLGSASIKLAALTTDTTLRETVKIMDEARKWTGLTLMVTLMIRLPLSPKASPFSSRTLQWSVLERGESGKLFGVATTVSPSTSEKTPLQQTPLPPPPPPLPSTIAKSSQGEANELIEAQQYVETIKSYAVLEDEIGRLQADPRSSVDPVLVARLMLLEQKEQELAMAVDLGQLTRADYLTLIQSTIRETKRLALEAKRAGNLEEAKRRLHHIHLMEKELVEEESE